jgi:hypothetical protein
MSRYGEQKRNTTIIGEDLGLGVSLQAEFRKGSLRVGTSQER